LNCRRVICIIISSSTNDTGIYVQIPADDLNKSRNCSLASLRYHHHHYHHLYHIIIIILIIIIIIIIIIIVSFMQGIHTHIPEANHVPRE